MNYWNVNFDIAAFVMLAVMISFFMHTKWLPTYANRFFLGALCMRICTVVSDVVACVMLSHYRDFSDFGLYGSNLLYFLLDFTAACMVLLFALEVTVRLKRFPMPAVWMIKILYFLIDILIMSTVWNHWLFGIDEEGYFNGPGYNIFKIFLFCITIIAFLVAVAKRKEIHRIQLLSFAVYAVLHFAGLLLLLGFIETTPVGGITSALGLMIIYLAFQNPDRYLDFKTGLFNRRGLEKMGKNDLNDRKDISLFCVCLTNYQNVSIFYDKHVVERAMREIGNWCKKAMNDFRCYYIGKGRFVFAHKGEINTNVYKSLIRDQFAHPWETGLGEVTFTTIINYFPDALSTIDAEEMIDCIEAAFEENKRSGNASFHIMDNEIVNVVRRRKSVMEAIERTLERRAVQVFYQPIFDIESGEVNAVEALARIRDDKLGVIPPEEFISTAEQNGSIIDLGTQIFEKVCIFHQRPEVKALNLKRIDVNLSPIQCRYEWLVNEFRTIAFRYGANFKDFNFEITESATMDRENSISNVNQMNREGATFSLDDYGTGFSNLVSIHTIPFEYIKLDKSVVWAYVEQKNDILKHITEMFTAQGFKVIAEGVESKKMVDVLTEAGCSGLQGFYYSKPLTEDEFIEYMRSGNYITDSANK